MEATTKLHQLSWKTLWNRLRKALQSFNLKDQVVSKSSNFLMKRKRRTSAISTYGFQRRFSYKACVYFCSWQQSKRRGMSWVCLRTLTASLMTLLDWTLLSLRRLWLSTKMVSRKRREHLMKRIKTSSVKRKWKSKKERWEWVISWKPCHVQLCLPWIQDLGYSLWALSFTYGVHSNTISLTHSNWPKLMLGSHLLSLLSAVFTYLNISKRVANSERWSTKKLTS